MASKRFLAVLEWALATIGVTLAYFAFGRLALLLAIPPGYAAPVWPAAGVALAAILLLGYRVWPGVFLGSLLVNVTGAGASAGPAAILTASAIGLGAVLQSTVGAGLIRRWVGFPRSFDQPRRLLLATFLAGPLDCVLGASVGVTALLVSGTLTADQALGSWTTWWFGDTLGVLLVLPIASAWGMELQRTGFRKRLLVGVPLLIATSLVVLLFLDTRRTEEDNARLEFERRSEIMARVIEEHVAAKLDVVLSVVSLFNSSDAVTRSEFRRFVEPLIAEHAGLYGLSWNARVPAEERLAFEASARSDGVTGFEFTEQDSGGRLVRAGARDDYLPVYFIEPSAGNERALGFDLASDATRTEALARVRDSGELLATPPIALVQESGDPSGFLVFAPIYEPGHPLDTVAQRRRHLHSFVSAVFKSGRLFDNALRTFAREGIDCRVLDVSDPDRPELVYAGASGGGPGPHPAPAWSTTLELGGRTWSAEFQPTGDYRPAVSAGRSPAVLAAGLFFTSLLGGFLVILAGRAATIERVVDERTSDLSTANAELSREVAERMKAEEGLRRAHDQLEARVEERTEELVRANRDLQLEVQERQSAEDALRSSESRFRAVFQASAIGIAVGDPDGRLLEVNGYVGEMLGVPRQALLGRSLEEFLSPAHHPAVALGPNAAGSPTAESERRFRTADERFGWALVRRTPLLDPAGEVRYVLEIVEDITDRRRFEEQLSRSQKLESVGLLAGGIAHDFNNLLTAILGNLSLARREAAPSDEILPYLDQAERALTRAAGLTRQLLTFSKGGAPVTCDVDLPQLLQEAADFALGGSRVRCDMRLPADLWPVTADPGQLHQVVSNLLINAAQAMPDGGEVTIQAVNERVGPESTLEPGAYVKLTVQDRGVGIPAEYRSQIFDPYFTTKPDGSGLGLATAYSIVRKHRGEIVLAPDTGSGAAFHVYLPTSGQAPDRPEPGRPSEDADAAEAEAGAGRVLIMDDDPAIRTLVAAIVTRLGYDADLARDGGEAIASFGQAVESGRLYSAVILDLTIPGGMGGRETLQHMKAIDPDVRAIVSSGYSEDPVVADFRKYGFAGVVAKPYRVDDLANTLRSVVAGASDDL